MPPETPTAYTATIQPSYIDLKGIFLGRDFVRAFSLEHKKKYPIQIMGKDVLETAGTLQGSFVGGLAKMYSNYDLQANDVITLDFRDGTLILTPPADKINSMQVEDTASAVSLGSSSSTAVNTTPARTEETVFARQKLKHLHIPEFAPANLTGWN